MCVRPIYSGPRFTPFGDIRRTAVVIETWLLTIPADILLFSYLALLAAVHGSGTDSAHKYTMEYRQHSQRTSGGEAPAGQTPFACHSFLLQRLTFSRIRPLVPPPGLMLFCTMNSSYVRVCRCPAPLRMSGKSKAHTCQKPPEYTVFL